MAQFSRALLVAPLTAVAVAAVVPAFASDPSSGKVSTAAPKVEWTGTANGYGYYPLHSIGQIGSDEPCEAPTCDTFALEVVDSDDLTIVADNLKAGGPGSDSVEIDVVKPDGSIAYTESTDGKPATAKIKKAAKGAYEIRIITNEQLANDGSYKASATLGASAATVPTGASGPTGTPGPTGASGPSTPTPAPAPAASLSLSTKTASAKKSRKGLKLSISASAPVTNVVATLLKGKTKVASGKLAKLSGKATLTLKLKKALKPGKYTVVVQANDGSRRVALKAALTIKK